MNVDNSTYCDNCLENSAILEDSFHTASQITDWKDGLTRNFSCSISLCFNPCVIDWPQLLASEYIKERSGQHYTAPAISGATVQRKYPL